MTKINFSQSYIASTTKKYNSFFLLRYITNLPEFHDRTVGQIDLYKAIPEKEAQNIVLEMEYAKEESDLIEIIHQKRLQLKRRKLQGYQIKIQDLDND